MKILVREQKGDYTFDALSGSLSLTGLPTFTQQNFYLITNVSSGSIIYNSYDVESVGELSGSVLTLDYDTSAMHNGDEIQILMEFKELYIDFDQGLLKTQEQSPTWSRYTDYQPLESTQDVTTSWVDIGAENNVEGYNTLGTFIVTDTNDSETVYIRALGKYESGGTDEFEYDDNEFLIWSGSASGSYIDRKYYIPIPTNSFPYLQLQTKAIVSGSTPGDLTIYVNKKY